MSGVEHQALPERIEIDIHDSDHAHVEGIAAGAAEQAAQAHVLVGHVWFAAMIAPFQKSGSQQRANGDPGGSFRRGERGAGT